MSMAEEAVDVAATGRIRRRATYPPLFFLSFLATVHTRWSVFLFVFAPANDVGTLAKIQRWKGVRVSRAYIGRTCRGLPYPDGVQ